MCPASLHPVLPMLKHVRSTMFTTGALSIQATCTGQWTSLPSASQSYLPNNVGATGSCGVLPSGDDFVIFQTLVCPDNYIAVGGGCNTEVVKHW
jgi:hypothetical protein